MRMGLVHLMVLVLGWLAGSAFGQTTAPAAPRDTTAAIITLAGAIDDYSRDMMFRRFREAEAAGAQVIIIQLNTPGGLVTSALDITRFLRSQEKLHVVAYVQEQALSAGAMIALACNEIVMQPGSMIGDCAPIVMSPGGGLQSLGETERAKAESPILADFYASATRNGYDPLLIASMVTTKKVVHWVEAPDTGERKFVDPEQYQKLLEQGWKAVAGAPDPVNNGTLLTVNADLAEKLGLSRGSYRSADALAEARNLSVVARLSPGTGETLVGFLASAMFRAILVFVLIQTLYISLTHPGHGMPEAIATIALGILIAVPLLTGYASWVDILLILVGLAMIAIELFVIPGFGFVGIAGIGLMLIGLVMTFVGPEPSLPGLLPALPATRTMLAQGTLYVSLALVAGIAGCFVIARYMPSLPLFNRFILTMTSPTPVPQAATMDAAMPRQWPEIGAVGQTTTDLRPGGSASFADPLSGGDRIADVVSEVGFVPRGSKVIVRELRGAYAVVRTVAEAVG